MRLVGSTPEPVSYGARDVCDRMTGGDPDLEAEIVFGAFVCLELESRSAAAHLADEAAA